MPGLAHLLLALLALPQYGLSTLFVAAFVSATLLPLGSEPALFGLLELNPDLFWRAILVATAGNTLGGAVTWWMGYDSHQVVDKYRHSRTHLRALDWLERLGPKACLLAGCRSSAIRCAPWPAGSSYPFWPCLAYMAIGKLLRYLDHDDGAAGNCSDVRDVPSFTSGQPGQSGRIPRAFFTWPASWSTRFHAYTLNRKFITSPSLTTYSLPSLRILPASLAPCSPL